MSPIFHKTRRFICYSESDSHLQILYDWVPNYSFQKTRNLFSFKSKSAIVLELFYRWLICERENKKTYHTETLLIWGCCQRTNVTRFKFRWNETFSLKKFTTLFFFPRILLFNFRRFSIYIQVLILIHRVKISC